MFISALILILSIANGSIIPIDEELFQIPMKKFNLFELYPSEVSCIVTKNKPILYYGSPSAEIVSRIDHIESHPIEARLNYIGTFLLNRDKVFPPILKNNPHAQYQYSSRFIDTRLLRLLIRIAVNRRYDDEMHIQSACDIINFVRKKSPQTDFSYLTPQYILDWYYILGRQRFTVTIPRGGLDLSATLYPSIVKLSTTAWHEYILVPRIKRLTRTGYEYEI